MTKRQEVVETIQEYNHILLSNLMPDHVVNHFLSLDIKALVSIVILYYYVACIKLACMHSCVQSQDIVQTKSIIISMKALTFIHICAHSG